MTYPCYIKAPFSTGGRGVRLVRNDAESARALTELGCASSELMVQAPANGVYCQVQALFDHGKLLASHTSQQRATGMGGSAAARVSVIHEQPRGDVERLGAYLDWHGGLTLDYLFDGTSPTYIECNPRTVEPGNAVASGVDIPELQVHLSATAALRIFSATRETLRECFDRRVCAGNTGQILALPKPIRSSDCRRPFLSAPVCCSRLTRQTRWRRGWFPLIP